MAKPFYTPARCTAEIPLSPFDGVVCNALADVIVQEGPRCQSCFDEFGGTDLETPETITFEQMAVDERFFATHQLEIAVPCHKKAGSL